MADPSIIPYGETVKEIGLTLATICGLVITLKWLSKVHLLALNGRITTLEKELAKRDAALAAKDEKIDALQQQILAVTISNGHDLKALVLQMLANDKENREFLRSHQAVVLQLVEKVGSRACMAEDYKPHPHPTPRPELPSVPETGKNQRHG